MPTGRIANVASGMSRSEDRDGDFRSPRFAAEDGGTRELCLPSAEGDVSFSRASTALASSAALKRSVFLGARDDSVAP